MGGLILSNISMIAAMIWLAGKGVWNLSHFNTRFLAVEKDTNASHQKHRDTEKKLAELETGSKVMETVLAHHNNRLVAVESRKGHQ